MGSRVVPMPEKENKADVKPKPPQGYTMEEFKSSIPNLSGVPDFVRSGIDMGKVQQVPAPPPQTEEDKKSVAYVTRNDPYKVRVNQPDLYGGPVLNHELTHTFQNTRSADIGDTSAPVDRSLAGTPKAYDYGGVEGLKKASSISHFNEEQQANIVMDYKSIQDKYLARAKAGTATPAELRKLYEAHQAYHPLVKQLAAMPDAKVKIQPSMLDMALGRNMPSLDLKPEAPGLPSYDTPGLGVAPADPLLGGQSQPTARKVGEIKRFPNGKIGRWDGHGWRTQ